MMTREEQDQFVANCIRQRLDDSYPETAPHMVLNWLVVATIMEGDGDRSIAQMAPKDARQWDILGMLNFALGSENGKMTARILTED